MFIEAGALMLADNVCDYFINVDFSLIYVLVIFNLKHANFNLR